jgi:NAD(P)-dependent dehydrogenase (short-subunit alcohol dehydrogenase family)
MRQLRGRTALVTGATGGLGRAIVRRLAAEGMHVVASGRREDALAALVAELGGARGAAVPADLADPDAIDALVERAEAAVGPLDVLVSNAAVEVAAAFTALRREEVSEIVGTNLVAPLLLAQRVVPGMLARGRGHVVFVSSVAGHYGPGHDHPYAATKAGLIALTQSLRGEYADSPVGFSVVSPGFIAGDGMYQRMVEGGARSNRLMGATTPDKVAARLVEAIRGDLPELMEAGRPVRPLLALSLLAPRLAERLARGIGLHEFFRRVATTRGRDR